MTRIPVSSSNLASVGYDLSSKILEIEFLSGGIYQYFGIPQYVYDNLMSANSHGKYFAQNIKDVFKYRKIG